MTNNDLSLAFENCVIASAWKKPDSQILDTPEIYKLINRAAPYDFMNGIYRTRLNSENADKEIDVHYQFYRDNKISFRVFAGMLFRTPNQTTLCSGLRSFIPRV